jgi:hypothetical protein
MTAQSIDHASHHFDGLTQLIQGDECALWIVVSVLLILHSFAPVGAKLFELTLNPQP